MSLGENIKKARKQKKLTQKQLGALIGKSEISIRKYESNSVTPSVEVINNIADNLNVSVLDLINDDVFSQEVHSIEYLYDSIVHTSKILGYKGNILEEIPYEEILELIENIKSLIMNKINKLEYKKDEE